MIRWAEDLNASPFEEPLRAGRFLATLTIPWWIAGGWALDLSLGKRSRDHADVDITVLRKDQETLQHFLGHGWQFLVVDPALGSATRRVWLPGEALAPPLHEIHAERDGEHAEFLLEETSGSEWVYRRHDRVRRPIEQLGTRSPLGLPVIAAEVVLLFKAKAPRQQDIADLTMMLPSLEPTQISWLRQAIETAHPDSPFLERLPTRRSAIP